MPFVNTVDLIGDEALAASIIDKSVTKIDDNITAIIGGHAFVYCDALAEANFLSVTNVEASAFYNCTTLYKVNMPAVENIGKQAFYGCAALSEISIPEATSVGGDCFSSCKKLQRIDLPVVTSINSGAFAACSALTAVIVRSSSMCTLGSATVFYNTPIKNGTGYIYVPRALVDSYKAATNWSTYANQFRALEDYTVDGTITGELDPTKI